MLYGYSLLDMQGNNSILLSRVNTIPGTLQKCNSLSFSSLPFRPWQNIHHLGTIPSDVQTRPFWRAKQEKRMQFSTEGGFTFLWTQLWQPKVILTIDISLHIQEKFAKNTLIAVWQRWVTCGPPGAVELQFPPYLITDYSGWDWWELEPTTSGGPQATSATHLCCMALLTLKSQLYYWSRIKGFGTLSEAMKWSPSL